MKPDFTNDQLDTFLASWQSINKVVKDFTEADLKNALNRELVGNRRKDVAIRLHQTLGKVRNRRERDELIAALDDTPVFLSSFKV
jgi:hypothetical protein